MTAEATVAEMTRRLLAKRAEQDAWLSRIEAKQKRIARGMWIGWALALVSGFAIGFVTAVTWCAR